MAAEPTRQGLRTRLPALGRMGLLLASIALSVATYGLLPSTVRIRWMIGMYQHYGPTHAPTEFVLVGFPVLTLGLSIGGHWFSSYLKHLDQSENIEHFRFVYESCVLLILSIGVAVQLIIIALNL